MKYTYPAIFTEEQGFGYSIQFYDVKGAITQGATMDEALDNANDALCLTLYDMEERDVAIPKASAMKDIPLEKGQFVQFVSCDTDFYKNYFASKSIRKNVSLPEWMYLYGEQLGLNFSAVLQEALKQKFRIAQR
jgi:predicted RNase H-like HicB family nuclease